MLRMCDRTHAIRYDAYSLGVYDLVQIVHS